MKLISPDSENMSNETIDAHPISGPLILIMSSGGGSATSSLIGKRQVAPVADVTVRTIVSRMSPIVGWNDKLKVKVTNPVSDS